MNKIIIGLSLISLTLSNGYKTDFEMLPASDKQQIEQTQDKYISYGLGVNKHEIKIVKHQEDNKALTDSQQYNIYESKGNFEKGKTYKITYSGDFVTDIKEVK
ncbi:hypothetical protein K0O13_07855 [Mammaliicoccus sciuri]|uniref:hypothetical protein n=1 Tax=Mammaliicoccus sciuri TaxID=1296 RepID=UPI001C6302D2|nr:hypothetical protein [Mammaliicoccus sciuri]QYG30013.1 hypothetical protein K0O13_07855 [Mammaliicoccus sciuri]